MKNVFLALAVAFVVYACASSQLERSGIEGYATVQPPAAVIRPETHAALRESAERMQALADEARCKSNEKRLRSGECDR